MKAQSFKKGALERQNAGTKVKSKDRPELFHSNHWIQNSDWFIICKAEDTFALQKGTRICSASPTKKVTRRGRGARGWTFFWPNTCGWFSKVGPTGKKSHHQANHPQIGHDGTNSRIVCVNPRRRAPKLQNTCFLLKIHLSLQKGTNTYVQLHQRKKWATQKVSWKRSDRDLICSRRGLFAKVVILATQKIGLATAFVNTWFNLGGCENAVSPKASNS